MLYIFLFLFFHFTVLTLTLGFWGIQRNASPVKNLHRSTLADQIKFIKYSVWVTRFLKQVLPASWVTWQHNFKTRIDVQYVGTFYFSSERPCLISVVLVTCSNKFDGKTNFRQEWSKTTKCKGFICIYLFRELTFLSEELTDAAFRISWNFGYVRVNLIFIVKKADSINLV